MRHPGLVAVAAVVGIGVIAGVVTQAGGSSSPGTGTVTYVVSGDPANVTYGPAGSDLQGTVPMQAGAPLGDATYYALNAQLQQDGTVTCQILVNGTAVSSGTASGLGGLARCEIIRDSSGDWVDANTAG